jgi:tRNA threonylcarbamoyladenosine biosynthesis protein TsaB
MNLLVLDTSTARAVIGLEAGSGKRYQAVAGAPQGHGRDLVPRLGELLGHAGIAAADLDVIGVGLGPGSYTGLRVGVTAAKTLAHVTGAVLVGFDSLEAVARNAPPDAADVSIVADAHRGLVYTADFQRAAPGAPLVPVRPSQIEAIFAWLARLGRGVLVFGPGLSSPRIRPLVPPEYIAADGTGNDPDSFRLIELAIEVWKSGRHENYWLLEPRYLRGSAAEEKRGGAAPADAP